MKFFVNEECIGCGMCCDSCPNVFNMNDEGKAIAIDKDVSDCDLDTSREAMENCPVAAIEEV